MNTDTPASALVPATPMPNKPPDIAHSPQSNPNARTVQQETTAKNAPSGANKINSKPREGTNPPGSLGTSIRLIKERSVQMLTSIQTEYAAIADHFDKLKKGGLSPHSQETLNMIAGLIQTRVEQLVNTSLDATRSAAKTQETSKPAEHATSPIMTDVGDKSKQNKNRKPTTPATEQPTWARVAALGASKPDHLPPRPPRKADESVSKQNQQKADHRIMIRLPQGAAIQKAATRELLHNAREALGKEAAPSIKTITIVRSGLAIVPVSATAKAQILQHAVTLKKRFHATAVEEQVPRELFYVPYAPLHKWLYPEGCVDVGSNEYIEEVEAATGTRPLSLIIKGSEGEDTGTLLLSFRTGSIKAGKKVTLFGRSLLIKKTTVKEKIQQCERCWRFHPTLGCPRAIRCSTCGSEDHDAHAHAIEASRSSDPELHTRKCPNCHGPHTATSATCPARPSREPLSGRLVHKSRHELKQMQTKQGKKRAAEMALAKASIDKKAAKSNKQLTGETQGSSPSDETTDDSDDDGDEKMATRDPEPEIAPAAAPTLYTVQSQATTQAPEVQPTQPQTSS